MFENRTRRRNRKAFLLVVALLLVTAFAFSFYMNYGGDPVAQKDNPSKDKADYKIPDSIRNIESNVNTIIPEVDAAVSEQTTEQIPTTGPDNRINENTKVIFKTTFTLCGHNDDKEPESMKEFVGLTEVDLRNKYEDWNINEFNTRQVILRREVQSYCKRHYSINAKDGYIVIYKFDSDGQKVLYEETETSISTLPPEDQKNLEYGIIADSDDELNQKLEGFSE